MATTVVLATPTSVLLVNATTVQLTLDAEEVVPDGGVGRAYTTTSAGRALPSGSRGRAGSD